jgi:hypothetical protein
MSKITQIAIPRSNGIQWKGCFEIPTAADELIFHDEIQYTWRDWHQKKREIAQEVQFPVAFIRLRVVHDCGFEKWGVYA